MKITMKHIESLLGLFDIGLVQGAGRTINQFCVQQAVNRVIHEDLKNPDYNDHPIGCIRQELISLGIYLNDCASGIGKKQRADALKRFAVAEMGSTRINMKEFRKKVKERIGDEYYNTNDHDFGFVHIWMGKRGNRAKSERLKELADILADVLKEMGTEGSQFLYLVDEPDKKKQANEAHRLGHDIYATQLAEMDSFGTGSCESGSCSHLRGY